MSPVELHLFWNFRSPYCYLASTRMWDVLAGYHTTLAFHPLPGWIGRSPPERAAKKVPLTRQDVARWARRYGVPMNPPPISTDPTRAAAACLLAVERDKLRPYVTETMRIEWAEGQDIGQLDVLREIGRRCGLDPEDLAAAADDPQRHAQLEHHVAEAEQRGVIGVPTFVVGPEIFWGNDRIELLEEHLIELRVRRW